MPLHRVTIVVLMLLLTVLGSSCAKKIPPPAPLEGIDIYDGNKKGDICFSQFYLNNYLQWKSTSK